MLGFSSFALLPMHASRAVADEPVERLIAAYPEHLAAIEGRELIWRDGTRMPLGAGDAAKPFARWLANPDIADIFRFPYPAGTPLAVPAPGFDPGRARPLALFNKMYGDCTRGEVALHLVDVAWLPRKGGGRLRVTRVNGVAERLAAISAALDALPAQFDAFLVPSAGGYNCRSIAGSAARSAHSYGIAVDLATARADYWRWTAAQRRGRPATGEDATPPAWRNRLPPEIIAIFEANGFIWGGRWSHFDTMHFEYRPELFHSKTR